MNTRAFALSLSLLLACSPPDQADMTGLDLGMAPVHMSRDARMDGALDATMDLSPDLVIDEGTPQNPYEAQLRALDTVYEAYLTNCELYQRCYPDRFKSHYLSTEMCALHDSHISLLRVEVERLSISQEQADACLESWRAASCLDVSFRGEIYTRPECVFTGPQEDGELCYYNASCKSGFCDHGWSFPMHLLCKERRCAPSIQPGEPCTERNYCPPGLYCENQIADARCVAKVEPFGTDCRTVNLPTPCPNTFYCHEETGECLPSPVEGETCDSHASCVFFDQLECDRETNLCVKVPDEEWYIPDGGSCKFQQSKCLPGSYCKNDTFCKRSLTPGDPCNAETECGPSLYCTDENVCDYRSYEAECRARGLRFTD